MTSVLLSEAEIDGRAWLAAGRARAETLMPGRCPFLEARGVASELEEKRRAMAAGRLTFHAQIGYRSLAESRTAWREIHDRLAGRGWAPDRYGICLDWSMGLPAAERAGGQQGTGLILQRAEDYRALTAMAPVAPHFGDFVLGMPGAPETAAAAVEAGATAIGNLSQYFTFRLPGHHDDLATTRATVEALGMLAAAGPEILIHSNLDDGYAAWFDAMGSTLGFALVEKRIVEELIGLPLGHCYGHTFSQPVKRLAFKLALAEANPTPGTMIYGNTTLYGASRSANYGALASYMLIDIAGQLSAPTGHALTPIPVSEAERIPTAEEVVSAHEAARRLAERAEEIMPLIAAGPAAELAAVLLPQARAFADRLLDGLDEAGVDLADPGALLLALRRTGPEALEARYGEADAPSAIRSSHLDELVAQSERVLGRVSLGLRQDLMRRRPKVLVATTDVHIYGKRLLELVLGRLEVEVLDGGVSVEAERLAETAERLGADLVAVSTYNGLALSYVRRLRAALGARGLELPIYIGGRLNEIMGDGGDSLPTAVQREIAQTGARPCETIEDFLAAVAGAVEAPR